MLGGRLTVSSSGQVGKLAVRHPGKAALAIIVLVTKWGDRSCAAAGAGALP